MQTKTRPVTQVIDPRYVIEGADVLLRRSFGPERANLFDPFLLFDHFAFNDPVEGPIHGFPNPPTPRHRNRDLHAGRQCAPPRQPGQHGRDRPRRCAVDDQRAGHPARRDAAAADQDGQIDGFQLWVNLPAAQKMSQPRYQEISAAKHPGRGATRRARPRRRGEFDGVRGPVTEIAAEPLYMDITLEPGAEFCLPVPAGHTVMAYVFEGEGVFGLDADGDR